MTKLLVVLKKIFCWLGIVFSTIFVVLFVGGRKRYEEREIVDDVEEINAKAAKKREEEMARIERADARELAESYGAVCNAIADGKERFRRRCKRADN